MNISVLGSGYVGLITSACMADVDNNVICYDSDKSRIDKLQHTKFESQEPELSELIEINKSSKKLQFSSDIKQAIDHGVYIFITLGTTRYECGLEDKEHVLTLARQVGKYLNDYKVVILKSTAPIGTSEDIKHVIQSELDKRKLDLEFDVVCNPEFLREGMAIHDFQKPDRIVLGCDNDKVYYLMQSLFSSFCHGYDRMIKMDLRSAELTKYAANAMLATKITLMNELSNIAERTGADIENVRIGIGADSRIGHHFIYAGPGFGGACFPKDLRRLMDIAESYSYDAELLKSVERVNNRQKLNLLEKIKYHFGASLKGKTICLWGLAFKAQTDDMEEAPSRTLIEQLWQEGVTVQAYDPMAMNEARRIYGDREDFSLMQTANDALKAADALVIMTEWTEFRSPDFSLIKQELSNPVIFDGRNLYSQNVMDEYDITYYAIGRGKPIFNQQ